jgi:hypothetical protein
MSTRIRRAVASALLLLPLGACPRAPEPPADSERPAEPAAATLWRSLGTWSGRGNRQTESFDVTSGAMRLAWETHGEGAAGTGWLRVSLHSAISGRPLQVIVDTRGIDSDTTRLVADPRVAYLLIESERVDWRLTLEEGVATSSGAASTIR